LLSHHSGLTRSQGFDELPTRDELARRRHTLVLHHPPGERYDYCNLNYGLLGLVVETLVDEPFADYVRRRVFVPAGMNSSTCSQTGPKDSWAPEYKYCFGFARRVQATAAPAAQVPAGFIRCSVGDLARLQVILAQDGAIDGRGVFDASIIQQMKSPWGGGKFGYGMGVQTGNYAGEPLLAHEGATPTAYAFHGYLPGRDLGIVLLTNINLFDPFTDHGEAVVKNVFQILADQPPQRVYPVRIWVRWVVLGAVLLAAWRLGRRWLGRRQAPWRWRLPARRNDRVALAASVIVTVVVWYGVLHWTQIRLTALFDLEPDMMWSVVFLTLASLVLDWQQRLAKEDQAETGSAAVRDAASPG
jgi:CubicO group peptidase (beta-lactamase class C family)